jgi:hypothetical protein
MIITGRTISQLPILSAITSASTLILQTGNTTFKVNLLDFSKSSVFGTIGQDLLPLTSNTFSIGTTGSTIKSLYVTSGSVIVGQNGLIGIDASGNTYSTSGFSTPSLFIGNVTSDGTKSSGTSINIISGDTVIVNQSGETINLFKQIVPTGGSISQVLAKDSGSDYDYSWQNLQGLYITGATSNGNGLNIYQSATTSTLAFKTVTSITPTHITIADSNGLLSISGTGLLSISNNGSGAFIAQSGTSSTVALRSLSSSTPTNLSINAVGDSVVFNSRTFITTASNSGSGEQVFQSQTTSNLAFRSLSSTTSALTINASGNHVLFNIRPKYYGAFQDDFTQTATTNNVGIPMLFRIIDLQNGISIVSGVNGYSKITFPESGVYNLQFSSQYQNTDNAERTVNIWLRRQGNDVVGSAGYLTVPRASGSNYGEVLPSWNYLVSVTSTTDYYELVWSTDSATGVSMKFYTAGNPPPSAASSILTVTEI